MAMGGREKLRKLGHVFFISETRKMESENLDFCQTSFMNGPLAISTVASLGRGRGLGGRVTRVSPLKVPSVRGTFVIALLAEWLLLFAYIQQTGVQSLAPLLLF